MELWSRVDFVRGVAGFRVQEDRFLTGASLMGRFLILTHVGTSLI